jgi:hypothetical protein
MLLVLIIILILIWAAVVWSIYSNFLIFYSNFSETENYHRAYYASISALERWELVVKQRLPWYQWSGWRYRSWTTSSKRNTWSQNSSLLTTDWVISSNFSYLSNDREPSKIIRSVDSRTTRIPKTTWNVEFTLRSSDSSSYNAMDYENAEVFLLYYDNPSSNESQYKKATSTWCSQSFPSSISWRIRLPKHLIDAWGYTVLDTWMSLIWVSNELPGDDTIVDRQIRWTYAVGLDYYPYTIFSTQKVHSGGKVDYRKDSIFRESDLNNSSDHSINFGFWGGRNTIQWIHGEWPLSRSQSNVPATIISQQENSLKNKSFGWIFQNSTKKQIRFNLLNLVKDRNWKIYPFLEYYINFWAPVSDKYFTIKWEWAYHDFEVNTIIQKPTVKETVFWDFTSIF